MLNDHERALSRLWRGKVIARAMTGHVTGLEIALRNASGAWEAGVHSHSLVALQDDYFNRQANLYLTQRQWVAHWRRALRCDYNPICHVTAVQPGDSVHASLRECVKYAIAPHKLFLRGKAFAVDPLVAVHLADALYKRRLVRFGGCFAATRRLRAARAMRTTPPQSNPR